MATAFDTIFQDFPSFLLVSIMIFFTVFLIAGLALVYFAPENPHPSDKKGGGDGEDNSDGKKKGTL
ncbi:MAG: hypothetical protein V1820_04830, partial [archaeon]